MAPSPLPADPVQKDAPSFMPDMDRLWAALNDDLERKGFIPEGNAGQIHGTSILGALCNAINAQGGRARVLCCTQVATRAWGMTTRTNEDCQYVLEVGKAWFTENGKPASKRSVEHRLRSAVSLWSGGAWWPQEPKWSQIPGNGRPFMVLPGGTANSVVECVIHEKSLSAYETLTQSTPERIERKRTRRL